MATWICQDIVLALWPCVEAEVEGWAAVLCDCPLCLEQILLLVSLALMMGTDHRELLLPAILLDLLVELTRKWPTILLY